MRDRIRDVVVQLHGLAAHLEAIGYSGYAWKLRSLADDMSEHVQEYIADATTPRWTPVIKREE